MCRQVRLPLENFERFTKATLPELSDFGSPSGKAGAFLWDSNQTETKFMKTSIPALAVSIISIISFAVLAPSGLAQVSIPSDGSDGALIVSADTVIDLSNAIAGAWNANNVANAGKGIYDSNKWAVVFKYSSVVISNGATLTFANHPGRAPVVWLVSSWVNA